MFKIEITEIKKEKTVVKRYQKLHDKEEFDSKADPQYGYVEVEGIDPEENIIYTQQVESLDIVKVIVAINGTEETGKGE